MDIKLSLIAILMLIEMYSCESYKGDVTFYKSWRGGYGSCGLERSRHDPFYVAALSRHFMKTPPNDHNPNHHPLCRPEHCVQVYGARGSVVLKISDTCPECKDNDVDVADEVFPRLDDPVKGRVKMTWKFVDCRRNPPGPKSGVTSKWTVGFQSFINVIHY